MPYLTLLLFGSAAGIALHAGVTHLLIGLARHPRDQTQVRFALLALVIAAHTLAVLALHTAPSVAAYLRVHKYLFGPTALGAFLGFLWFVASYTGTAPRRLLLGLSLWVGGLILLHLALPFGLLYSRISGLRTVTLPWGEQIVLAQGPVNPWRLSFDLFNLTLVTFFVVALTRQYRRGSRRAAVRLGLALSLFVVARVVDTLVVLGVIEAFLTSSLAFVAIAITMSLHLSYGMSATERALHHSQQRLQAVVAARTVALARANAYLAALNAIADIALHLTDLPRALHQMCAIVLRLFQARAVLLRMPAPDPLAPPLLIGVDRHTGTVGPLPLTGMAADVAVASSRQIPTPSPLRQALPRTDDPPPVDTWLLPLSIPGTTGGVLAIETDPACPSLTADEIRLIETIAADISVAITTTRLYQNAVAARERLTRLYQAAQAISQASLDPARIAAEIHRAVSRMMPTDAIAILLLDTNADEIVEVVYRVDARGHWPEQRTALAGSWIGALLDGTGPQRVDDFSANSPIAGAVEVVGNQPPTQSGIAVLLRGSDQVLGGLCVQSARPAAYTDADGESLHLLATHAAIALENARRYAQARSHATSEERTRLARELHDSVTQTLFSASLLAEVLPTVWQRNPSEGTRNLRKLRQLVRGALAEMRTLLFELRPAALLAADLGLLLHQLGDVLSVLGNDSDADGDPLTAEIYNPPAHGTLTLNANGSFTYTPTSGYLGADSFTYTTTDGALESNVATVTLAVSYPFAGFFPPVDNPPTLNQVNAGQGIPIKFSLGGDRGLGILAAGSPVSQQIDCPSGAPIDDIEQTTTSPSGLTYDASSDRYTYVWKTESAWSGTCRQFTLRLADGTDHLARFTFK